MGAALVAGMGGIRHTRRVMGVVMPSITAKEARWAPSIRRQQKLRGRMIGMRTFSRSSKVISVARMMAIKEGQTH